IYFSLQVSFHTLGKDYHALTRRFQFDHDGAKLEVRKELEACAGRRQVGFTSSPRDPRASSFDEPLASALGAHYALPPPVLPMLPNGSPVSFRSSIPISTMTGFGTEGLGGLRRDAPSLARSPPARRAAEATGSVEMSVPLEFDEDGD
ncbi:hypothetical protein B0H10DRAFT_1736466, partial [Mycena sp. CBHHK59/15]